MQRFLRNCRESRCPELTRDKSGYCDAHRAAAAEKALQRSREFNRERYDNDAVYRMYTRAPWPNFRLIVLRQNPICARIIGDRQCEHPSTLVHHLQSPRVRPDLFVDPKNVVALCEHCHLPDEGTPWWVEGKDYVKTVFRISILGEQQPCS